MPVGPAFRKIPAVIPSEHLDGKGTDRSGTGFSTIAVHQKCLRLLMRQDKVDHLPGLFRSKKCRAVDLTLDIIKVQRQHSLAEIVFTEDEAKAAFMRVLNRNHGVGIGGLCEFFQHNLASSF